MRMRSEDVISRMLCSECRKLKCLEKLGGKCGERLEVWL